MPFSLSTLAVGALPATLGGVDLVLGSPCLLLVLLPLARIAVCWYTYDAFRAIPQQYRFLDPPLVWLLLIPGVSLVWNFFVFPRLVESFQYYLYGRGIADYGDCGQRLARGYAICYCFIILPCIGVLATVAAACCIVLLLVRAQEMKRRILLEEQAAD